MVGELRGDFNAINENLLIIQEQILNNEKICKLLEYETSDPLSKDPLKDPYKLVNDRKVNTFPYIHQKTEDKISFVNVFASYVNKAYDNPKSRKINISVIVVSHSDIWNTRHGLRPILIMSEIDDIVNGSKALQSIGKVDFEFARPVEINRVFYGYEIMYSFTGFNNYKRN